MECFEFPRLRPNWPIQTKESFGKLPGGMESIDYIRGTQGKDTKDSGKTFGDKGCWESLIRKSHLLVTLQAVV